MVTDRSTTAGLCVHLARIYPESWAIAFQLLIALDLSSHYMHMHSSLSSGSASHKSVSKESLLYYYYAHRSVLFVVCALNELFYIGLYLLHYKSLFGEAAVQLMLWVAGPVWALKQAINVVQLGSASMVLAELDAKQR